MRSAGDDKDREDGSIESDDHSPIAPIRQKVHTARAEDPQSVANRNIIELEHALSARSAVADGHGPAQQFDERVSGGAGTAGDSTDQASSEIVLRLLCLGSHDESEERKRDEDESAWHRYFSDEPTLRRITPKLTCKRFTDSERSALQRRLLAAAIVISLRRQ